MLREKFLLYLIVVLIVGNLSIRYILGLLPADEMGFWTAIIASLAISFLIILLFVRKSLFSWLGAFMMMGVIGVCTQQYFKLQRQLTTVDGTEVSLVGVIEDISTTRKGKCAVTLHLQQHNTIVYDNNSALLRSIISSNNALPGDTLFCRVFRAQITNFTEDFDYVSYMADKEIFYNCFLSNKSLSNLPYLHKSRKVSIRHKIIRWQYIFKNHLPLLVDKNHPEHLAFLIALSCGDKSEITQNATEAFRRNGVAHLLALSGLHVGIIYAVISFILTLLGNSPPIKKIRSLIIIIALWFYALFTGMGISIVRAVLMATIYELGAIAGRDRNGLNSLSLSALLIIMFNPNATSQISFILSYGAMLGIFIIYPVFQSIKVSAPVLSYIWKVASISISCQLLTAPIIYYYFGTFSSSSLLSNVICTPLISIIMMLIPASLTFRSISFVGDIFIYLLNATLSLLDFVVNQL